MKAASLVKGFKDRVVWTYVSATLPLNKSCYFHKAVNQKMRLRLLLLLAVESMSIKSFGFSAQQENLKSIIMNVRYTHQSQDRGSP